MKLYFHPKSPNATAVLAVAYEFGIALDLQEVNLPGGEQRQSAFLKINPNGKVPALEDGDFVLWESGAIMQYLAAQKPGNSLWPADNRVRADITRWQLWRMGEWGRGAGTVVQPDRKDRIVEEVVALIPATSEPTRETFFGNRNVKGRSGGRKSSYLAPRSISATISRAATTGSLASRIGRPTTM